MTLLLGIDGCPAGWIAAAVTYANDQPVHCDWRLFPDFSAIVAQHRSYAQIAIDMPIGLLAQRQKGGRICDQLARKAIRTRHSSVFSAPPRPALYVATYAQARPFGLSIQTFNICKKIREIDDLITPALQEQLFEAHPELGFTTLSGSPMQYAKRKQAGRAERIAALTKVLPQAQDWLAKMPFRRNQVAADDAIDALILAHVAQRKHVGHAVCLPATPPRDAKGLAMAIWG